MESSVAAYPEASLDARQVHDLLELLKPAGPSGFESRATAVWADTARGFADVRIDPLGTAFARVNTGAARRISLTGHVDEIGLIVNRIDERGFLRCTNIGGWDVAVLVGQRVRILTRDGNDVVGGISRGAVHQLSPDARKRSPEIKDVWIDIGAIDGDHARSLVTIGDPAVVDVDPVRLGERRLMARALDNRVGAFISLEVARACSGVVDVEVVAVASVHEETGGAGAITSAAYLQPDAAVVIDVTTPSDTPLGLDAGEYVLGKGPIVTRGASTTTAIADSIMHAGEQRSIPFQRRGLGIRTATDADWVTRAGHGVPTGLINVPGRNLHSPVEIVDLGDIRHAIDLLTGWIEDMAVAWG